MKKKVIVWLCVILLVLAAVLTYSYFRVDGRELRFIADISEDYTATVTKTHASLEYRETEYVLNGEQILQLQALILDSSFTRRLSPNYSYSGLRDTYQIVLELTDPQGQQQDFIILYCVEDLYLSISAPYDGVHLTLKINNPQWHAELDAILSGS